MDYTGNFSKLSEAISKEDTTTYFENLEIHKSNFNSLSSPLLPGLTDYYCAHHALDFKNNNSYFNDIGTIENNVHQKDVVVEENRCFNYYLVKPKGNQPVKKVIFLFHGFNEKNWDKYLLWATAICERTQSGVILFPIAFHMQRAPLSWSEKRQMFRLSEDRKRKFPNIIHSTLSNVAISMRLHAMPQRFIWSGLQTYYDIIQFIEDCKAGKNPLIDREFTFNIFAYSIGGFLAEILTLSNYKNYFSHTKVCLFCGGAVFNRLSPVSKYILDSEADVALYSYLVEHLDSFLKKDAHLRHYLGEDHFEGQVFRAMLDYQKMRGLREELFKKMEAQFYAITLKKDEVIPTFEIINTLNGAFRNINILVEELDFEHKYTHENPFPISKTEFKLVDQNFNIVFDKVGDFFNTSKSE